jgi:hypothetical protein
MTATSATTLGCSRVTVREFLVKVNVKVDSGRGDDWAACDQCMGWINKLDEVWLDVEGYLFALRRRMAKKARSSEFCFSNF